MNFLFLHNRYLIAGGEDISTQSEIDLLIEHGHNVNVIYFNNEDIASMSSLKLAVNTVWSRESYNIVSDELKRQQYDIVHVQNFFPLFSPSVFKAAKDNGVKVVMSVRNYRLICPNALLYTRNDICTRCVKSFLPIDALRFNCYKDDFKATFVVAAMLTYNKLVGTWSKYVDGFIAISKFVKMQLIEGGIEDGVIHVKYNFINNPPAYNDDPMSYFLYVGRLSVEKGIQCMLDAFSLMPNIRLKIIGNGPLSGIVEDAAEKYSNIDYLGKLSPTDVYDHMRHAFCLVFPSQWNEPFGRTIIESFAVGTPVIGSAIGGVTELIKDDYNGYLYQPGNSKDLVDTVSKIINSGENYIHLRRNAHESYLTKFTSEISYNEVMKVYTKVLNNISASE